MLLVSDSHHWLMAQLHKCAAIPTRDRIRGLGKAEIILLLRQLFYFIFPDYIALILIHSKKLQLRLINCHTISVLLMNLRLGRKPKMLFKLLQHNQYELNQ